MSDATRCEQIQAAILQIKIHVASTDMALEVLKNSPAVALTDFDFHSLGCHLTQQRRLLNDLQQQLQQARAAEGVS